MPLHARPIPAPARLPGGRNDASRPEVRLSFPGEDTPVARSTASLETASAASTVAAANTAVHVVDASPSRVAPPDRQHEATVPAAARDTPWPWYRREPWFSVVLAAYVPIVIALAAPQRFHAPLLGLGILLLVTSIAMLIRQGPFRPHPRPPRANA